MMNAGDELKYSYSSKPRAVQTNRSKAAGQQSLPSKPAPPNIMHDPRIARGSVFAPSGLSSPRSNNNNNDKPKKRRSQGSSTGSKKENLFSPHRVASHSFTPFSLEEHLVEQPRVVVEREVFSQTDEFVRYMTPKKKIPTADGKFHRPKVGVDSGTQIEESDKLFNFDVEVRPLLNVLVSKTLAQALAEVKEELEMDNIVHERKVLVGHKAEAERVDKELENKAKEAFRLKEKTKRDQELKQQQIKVMKEKVLAWQLAHSTIIPDVLTNTTAALEKKGVFYNPLHRDLSHWLANEIYHGSNAKLRLRSVAAALLDDLLFQALRRQTILAKLLPHEDEALVRINLRDPIFVTMDDEDPSNTTSKEVSVLGPVALSRHDSLELIEQKLQAWVSENVGLSVVIPHGGFLSLLNITESI